MPLHPEAVTLLQIMEAVGTVSLDAQSPAEARASRAAAVKPSGIVVPEIRDLDAGGVPGRLYRPTADPGAVTGLLVYLHGGGWVLGSIDSHDDLCRALCVRSGLTVLSLDYRLAPEDPFPAGLEDAIAGTRWAVASAAALGCDPARVAIGGDSAGANLAAVVANEAVVPLVCQLLIYPVADARMVSASYEENAEGYFLTASSMRWFRDHYLAGGQGDPADPRVSPLLAPEAVLAAAPPALVITAEFDPLRDEGVAYAERLAMAGVPTSHVQFSGTIHGFASFAEFLTDGDIVRSLGAAYLRRTCGP